MIRLYRFRNIVVLNSTGLSGLEEDVRILSGSSNLWMFRIQCVLSESLYSIHIYDFSQIIVIDGFNLLNFMGCSESIKEVKEWNASLNG